MMINTPPPPQPCTVPIVIVQSDAYPICNLDGSQLLIVLDTSDAACYDMGGMPVSIVSRPAGADPMAFQLCWDVDY